MNGPARLRQRTVGEWSLTSSRGYASPFADVLVEGVFTAPDGRILTMPGFYDGEGTWKVRFNPDSAGEWRVELHSRPANPELVGHANFAVEPNRSRGFLKVTPGRHWGFAFENGEPFLAIGDTTYDLFGMDYCGGDVAGFIARRRQQGHNLFRVRLTNSEFHPPDGDFAWQNKPMWPWGGSRSAPRFDRFNLDWFRSIDRTVAAIEAHGDLGLEMIMEAWGFEFPFNHRAWFTAEWEELWLRYLFARYDAYRCVYFWTPLNEYEYYPNGDWNYKVAADRWALRIGRWYKTLSPHQHISSVHNGPRLPPFAERFRADPEAIDAVMFQEWGARDKENSWLATGIEESIERAFAGWTGSVVFAEWGYERNPTHPLKLPGHEFCFREHTRRSAWRGVTQALGIINGQENSWGPWMELDTDLPGVADIVVLKDFFTSEVPFHTLRKAKELVSGEFAPGHRPLALASADGRDAVVYFPAGGSASIAFTGGTARWFDPRSGAYSDASAKDGRFSAPAGADADGHPLDSVLVIRK
jgi:hypothetical protein